MAKPNLTRLTLFILLSLNFFFDQSLDVNANNIQQAITDTSRVVKFINPIALSSIGAETEKTLTSLREYRRSLISSKIELRLDSIIPIKIAEIELMKSVLDLREIDQMKIRELEKLKANLTSYKVDFDTWRKGFAINIDKLFELQSGLVNMNKQWTKTLELDRNEKLPAPITNRIKANLLEISRVSKAVSNRNNILLTKQSDLTSALIFIDEVLNSITSIEKPYQERILAFDMPFLWQVFSAEEGSPSTDKQIQLAFDKHRQELSKFWGEYAANVLWHIFFFLIFLLLLFYSQKNVSRWTKEKKDEANGQSLFLLQRPISSAILISILFTGLMYPNAPSSVLNYYYILFIIPLVMLLPGLLKQISAKYIFYIAIAFFFIEVGDHFSEVIVIDRLVLLIVELLTLYILIQLLKRQSEIEKSESKVNWQFAFLIMRIAVFLLGISTIANVVGNSFFAKDISRGTLTMLYGGMIIYASAFVLRGIFSLLIQQNTISQLNMIQNHSDEVKKHVYRAIKFGTLLYWVYFTLNGFLIYNSLYNWFFGVLTREWELGSVVISIGSILAFFLTLWISLALSRFIRFILQDEILTHFELPRGVPGAISMIVKLVLITMGFVLAFGAAKIDMSNIAIIFGALSVGIGFGLQNIFNNLVSGLILVFERPVQVGDIIQISNLNLMGEVKEIGIRASIIRTFDGAEIIVPNGNLISNEVINWTLSDKRKRQEIIVGVAYGTDTTKVLEVLNSVINDVENVINNPAPQILFQGFGDSSLNFRVLFWTPFDIGFIIKSDVGVAIDLALKNAGIVIPFPQRDLHLKSTLENDNQQIENSKVPVLKNRGHSSKDKPKEST